MDVVEANAGRLYAALLASGDIGPSPTGSEVTAALARRMASPMTCVPLLRTGWEEPTHLAAMSDAYVRAEAAARGDGPPVLACFSAPAQVGKSTLGEVAYAWWLGRNPTHHLGSLLYGQDLADDQSRRIRDDVIALGVELRGDSAAVDHWQTTRGGGLLSRGLMGGITGQPGLACVRIDDPYRNRLEAESVAHRRRVNDTLRSTVFTRRNPRTSVILKHTRWAPDDLIGFVEKTYGTRFEHHRCPAVDDNGVAIVRLAGRDDAFWAEQRELMGEHDWWSLMMGLPRPREGSLFSGEPAVYSAAALPREAMQVSIGVDFAYSTRSKSDHSVAVVLGRVGATRYVLDVVRRQCTASDFAVELRALSQRHRTARMHAYIGGTELGVVDLLRVLGVSVIAHAARADKHARAQACAAAWSSGRVALPEDAPWLDAFVGEVRDFTGDSGGRDDQVDALVAAFDALSIGDESTAPAQPGPKTGAWMERASDVATRIAAHGVQQPGPRRGVGGYR